MTKITKEEFKLVNFVGIDQHRAFAYGCKKGKNLYAIGGAIVTKASKKQCKTIQTQLHKLFKKEDKVTSKMAKKAISKGLPKNAKLSEFKFNVDHNKKSK